MTVMIIGALALDGWVVAFGTAVGGLGVLNGCL